MLRLEPRIESSRCMSYLSPLIAIVMMIVGGMIMFSALGKSPLQGFYIFFIAPINDLYGLSELLLKATPLMLCAIGLAIGFRANIWNIGAEGQYVLGAISASAVALYFYESEGLYILPLMVIAGCIGGMLWAAIPAFLKIYFNTNEILVSLMLVYVAQLLVSYLVFGPMMDPDGFNFPQSRLFESSALLPILIDGTRLNLAFGFAMVALLAGYILMYRSFLGYQMTVAGAAPNAARYAGFSVKAMVWVGLLVGGAMAGLAGMSEVAGPMGQLTQNVSNGYGFAAIIVAFVARLNPIGIFFASLLMALLYLGGEQAQQHLNLPSSISNVFQGMLLMFLLASDVFINYRIRWKRSFA